MAIDAVKALPYGLRDVKLTPITANVAGAITYGTMVDLPVSRTLSWTDSEDFTQLRGDDVIVAERGNGSSIAWDLEEGGISLECYAILAGGTVSSSGTTPAVIKKYSKITSDARPYFRIDGQAINDNGGDFKVVLYRCKAAGDVGGELSDGNFDLTSASGNGYFNADGKLYDLLHYETTAGITQPV